MRVKPVRIARGEEKFFCAVGFWQFGFRRGKFCEGGVAPSEYFSPGPLMCAGAGESPSSKMAGTSVFFLRVYVRRTRVSAVTSVFGFGGFFLGRRRVRQFWRRGGFRRPFFLSGVFVARFVCAARAGDFFVAGMDAGFYV